MNNNTLFISSNYWKHALITTKAMNSTSQLSKTWSNIWHDREKNSYELTKKKVEKNVAWTLHYKYLLQHCLNLPLVKAQTKEQEEAGEIKKNKNQ